MELRMGRDISTGQTYATSRGASSEKNKPWIARRGSDRAISRRPDHCLSVKKNAHYGEMKRDFEPPTGQEPTMRILLVEDDEVSRQILMKVLRRHGEIAEAADGQAGFEAFQEAFKKGDPFKLICLDIMMPKLDGQAVLKGIRDTENSAGVPEDGRARVIMTTAFGNKENIMQALPHCDAYLTKPIDQSSLLFYLKKFGFFGSVQLEPIQNTKSAKGKNPGDVEWID